MNPQSILNWISTNSAIRPTKNCQVLALLADGTLTMVTHHPPYRRSETYWHDEYWHDELNCMCDYDGTCNKVAVIYYAQLPTDLDFAVPQIRAIELEAATNDSLTAAVL